MKNIPKNTFFDINKLPPEKGLLVFPISMARIATGQSPKECLKFIEHFSPSKISAPNIGLNFLYGDFLYLSSDKPAKELKRLFIDEMLKHKNEMQKILAKNHQKFQIQQAFNFQTWSDLYLDTKKFKEYWMELNRIYQKDKLFQKYLQEDCDYAGFLISNNQIEFFLEEHLLLYCIAMGKTKLRNDYIQNGEEWVLNCYPGKPMKHYIYLHQLNPFNLDNQTNKFKNSWYDLESKKLYNFDNLDLETWDYE